MRLVVILSTAKVLSSVAIKECVVNCVFSPEDIYTCLDTAKNHISTEHKNNYNYHVHVFDLDAPSSAIYTKDKLLR